MSDDKKPEPEARGRTHKQVNDDMQNAGFDKNPDVKTAPPGGESEPEPSLPEPKKKTPEEMNEDPEGALNIDEDTKQF